MNFNEFDEKMRLYETARDQTVLPGMIMVARLDGRNFTRLTKEVHQFEAPFDVRFRDIMLETVAHLMSCGFRVVYGTTQSDEISLLLHPEEQSFGRKLRKLCSVLAGEASAKFSLLLSDLACFDCRISQLPSEDLVVDYFRWRSEDAHRNALNAHCYWALRGEGQSASAATRRMNGLSVAEKSELLLAVKKVHFSELPPWHRRGSGLYWEDYEKEATDPRTGERLTATRRRLVRNLELPTKDDFSVLVRDLLSSLRN